MLMVEAVEAFLYLAHLTPALAEADDPDVGEIASRAALGDGNALNELMRRWQVSLARIAAARVGPDRAYDVIQDVFMAVHKGGFSKHAASFKADGRSAYLMLARAVANASLNMLKSKKSQELSGGGGVGVFGVDDDRSPASGGSIEPEDRPESGLSAGERELIFTVLRRARDTAKLSPKENQFVDELFKVGFFTGAPGAPKLKEIAIQIWPEKTPGAAGAAATRAKARFLKQLCLDPDLKQFRVGSSSYFAKNFEPLCAKVEDCDPVVVAAVRLGLMEDVAHPDRDKAYAEVLRWVCSIV